MSDLRRTLAELLRPAQEAAPGVALRWRDLPRPGDWAVAGLGLALVIAAYPLLWRGGTADRAIVKRDGRVVIELALNVPAGAPRRHTVDGALGPTVIEVQPGRARVLADPGPRQYCVQQGWLTRPGAVAICAPNHITLELGGGTHGIDSLNY